MEAGAPQAADGSEPSPGDASANMRDSECEAVVRRFSPAAPARLQSAQQRAVDDSSIIGSSAAARGLREKIKLYAEEDEPVLISGETGAGKERIARELHRLGRRAASPFVALNMGALPDGLASSELFGHVKGAFTGAVLDYDGAFLAADRGSLFLDEIGDMPIGQQVQLLRVLDDGVVRKLGARTTKAVDFRLICATNADLGAAISAGRFRRDLYYRIAVLEIVAPPLRERGDDVVELAEHFIKSSRRPEHRNARLTPNAADRLKRLAFPGNIRELKNIVAAAVVRARGGKILADHLPAPELTGAAAPLDVSEAKELVGRFAALRAVKLAGGNISKAAELAGRSRSNMHALLQGLDGVDYARELDDVRTRLRAFLEQ